METGNPHSREASIVLVGDFDPLQLVPQWFYSQGLIPPEDILENISVEIIYDDITRFRLPNISIEIQSNRVVLRSETEALDFRIVDLAIGIITLAKNVNVTALGLNLYEDYSFDDTKLWNGVGHMLAPKDVWREIMPDASRLGLASMQVQLRKPGVHNGSYNFAVSWLERSGMTRFQINDHYDKANSSAKGKKNLLGSDRLKSAPDKFDPVKLLLGGWVDSRDFYKRALNIIFSRAKKGLAQGLYGDGTDA